MDYITLFDFSLIGLLILVLNKKKPHLNKFSQIILLLGFCFLLWTLLSAFVASINILYSYGGLILYVKSFLVFFVIYTHIESTRDFSAVLYALFAALFFEATLGFYQWRFATTGLNFLHDTHGYYRSVGTFNLPNLYGAYLIMIMPIPLILIISKSFKLHWNSFFIWLVSGVSLLALLASYSRSAWIGFILQIFILIMLLLLRRKLKYRVLKFAIMIGLIVLPIIAIYGNRMIARFEHAVESLEQRNVLVDAAVETIEKNPVFGVGLKNYARFGYPKWLKRPVNARDPENAFLLIAVESGLPAVIFFVLILGITIFKGYKFMKEIDNKYLLLICAAILSAIIGFIVQNQGVPEFRHFPIQVLFWSELAILAKVKYLDRLVNRGIKIKNYRNTPMPLISQSISPMDTIQNEYRK
ncbi:MAG: O-antigen ligase family protein [bacterium]